MYLTIQININKLLPTSNVVDRRSLNQLEAAYSCRRAWQIPPIEVVAHPTRKGYFLITNGHHRTYLRDYKGLKTIKCDVLPDTRNIARGMASSSRALQKEGIESISDLVVGEH